MSGPRLPSSKCGDAAGDRLGVVTRHRNRSFRRDVPGHQRHVRGRVAGAGEFRERLARVAGHQVVERHHAVGEAFAEAADIADREHIGGDLHRQIAVIDVADPRGGDDGLGAHLVERESRIGAPPEQRQRHGDHAGAQNAEDRQHAFGGVGQLDADHRVGLQPELAQPHGDGGDDAVRLGKRQAVRRAVGEGLAVERIGDGDGVGAERRGAAEHLVDGRFRAGLAASASGIAEDHRSPPVLVRHWRCSGAHATRFPADSRTGNSPRDAPRRSSARPTGRAGGTAARRRTPTSGCGRARAPRR